MHKCVYTNTGLLSVPSLSQSDDTVVLHVRGEIRPGIDGLTWSLSHDGYDHNVRTQYYY